MFACEYNRIHACKHTSFYVSFIPNYETLFFTSCILLWTCCDTLHSWFSCPPPTVPTQLEESFFCFVLFSIPNHIFMYVTWKISFKFIIFFIPVFCCCCWVKYSGHRSKRKIGLWIRKAEYLRGGFGSVCGQALPWCVTASPHHEYKRKKKRKYTNEKSDEKNVTLIRGKWEERRLKIKSTRNEWMRNFYWIEFRGRVNLVVLMTMGAFFFIAQPFITRRVFFSLHRFSFFPIGKREKIPRWLWEFIQLHSKCCWRYFSAARGIELLMVVYNVHCAEG